jgi:hypothetical protein
MSRREQWRRVLDLETTRWSGKSCEELIAALHELQSYEVELESKTFQVEVEMLENTEEYVHVLVTVDDGVLPAAIMPAATSFICRKLGHQT